MALFKPILGYISGKVAGNVFSRNAAGSYLRQWVKPVQPQTERQTQQTELIAGLSRDWGSTLTVAQRAAWKALAAIYSYPNRLGDSIQLKPNMLFVKVNAARLIAGDSILVDAPTNLSVSALAAVEITSLGIGVQEVTFSVTPALGVNDKLYVRVALNVPTSRGFVKNLYRHMAVSAANVVNPIPLDIPADLGLPLGDRNCFFRCHRYNDVNGAMSPGFNVSAVAV